MEAHTTIKFPVFGFYIDVIYTDDIEASRKNRSASLGAPKGQLGKYVDGLCAYHNDEPDCMIFFRPDTTIGTIAHEAFHSLYRMFKWIGAKIENEITAYHLGYMIDEILKFKLEEDVKLQTPA